MLEARGRRGERQRGFGEVVAAVGRQHGDVAQVGERRGVGDDPDEADRGAVGRLDAEAEGVFEGPRDDVAWDAGGRQAAALQNGEGGGEGGFVGGFEERGAGYERIGAGRTAGGGGGEVNAAVDLEAEV